MSNKKKIRKHEAIVIGASAGGFKALSQILAMLTPGFRMTVVIVIHLRADSKQEWIKILAEKLKLNIKEAEEKETLHPGVIYVAPPNYHLLIEEDKTFSLSMEEKVNFARPSIDVLFESAAYAYNNKLLGIILTGANSDGAWGMKKIKEKGGYTIVQDPKEAEFNEMPSSVVRTMNVDQILPLKEIAELLERICNTEKK